MDITTRCVYTSSAARSFDESEIPGLLTLARAANTAAGLTGILLYFDRCFFQVLEGPERVVDRLFNRICVDRRHLRVTQIIRERIAERDFSEWTMGFQTLRPAEVASILGENDFFRNPHYLEQLNPGRARKLLEAFSRGRWKSEATGMHHRHARVG